MLAHHGGEGSVGIECQEAGKPANTCAPQHVKRRRRFFGFQKGWAQELKGLARLLAEGSVSARIRGSGKAADRINAGLPVGMQVERGLAAPEMARQRIGPAQGDEIGKVETGVFEHLHEDRCHGEYGGAAVDLAAAHLYRAHLAAGRGSLLKQGDARSLCSAIKGRGQAGNSGADDEHVIDRAILLPAAWHGEVYISIVV